MQTRRRPPTEGQVDLSLDDPWHQPGRDQHESSVIPAMPETTVFVNGDRPYGRVMSDNSYTPLTAAEVTAAVADPWRVIANALQVAYRTRNMVTGGRFVARIIDAAEEANHHPDIDLRYGSVHLSLTTHTEHRMTDADVALANRIADIAREMDLEPFAAPPARFELAIDALDITAIRSFWKTILGYDDDPDDTLDLVDPTGILPAVWFQQMDSPRPQRSRMHVDLWLPHDAVQERMAAAIDAGGHLVTDATLRRSGCSPTPRATRSACARGRTAKNPTDRPAFAVESRAVACFQSSAE